MRAINNNRALFIALTTTTTLFFWVHPMHICAYSPSMRRQNQNLYQRRLPSASSPVHPKIQCRNERVRQQPCRCYQVQHAGWEHVLDCMRWSVGVQPISVLYDCMQMHPVATLLRSIRSSYNQENASARSRGGCHTYKNVTTTTCACACASNVQC